ncbi:MAG: ubiquinone/menaquinone biosynthesis C-methylase UbiE [Oceanicoccus sp.]|jgi:ubiquinone/menaquinone biosynthesis C-methylase UbiE
MTEKTEAKGHSEEYFGTNRDYWYNFDFLELMAKRWNLSSRTSLLDVGCGQCHWSGLLSDFLPRGASVVAVDNDKKWSKGHSQLTQRFREKSLNFSIQYADAYSLPFDDNSFDVVTGQTVLIHLKSPEKALLEMKRVLKPGGILISAEPNNISQRIFKDAISNTYSIEERIEMIKYGMVEEEGKIKAGNGDNSLGDMVPGLFNAVGLKTIQAYLSDKCSTLIPPYASDEMKATTHWITDESDFKSDMDTEIKEYFGLHKGKYDDLFDKLLEREQFDKEELRRAIENESYHCAGAVVMYLVSGIKE